jgi:hypothetical protein
LRDEGEHGRRFGQNPLVGYQGRHAALGIDGKIVRLALLFGSEVDAHSGILGRGVLQGDMRGQRTGVRGVKQLDHDAFP